MKVKIISQERSIPEGLTFEIPNFTVLTGENGSGKSHLFKAMSDISKSDIFIDDKKLTNVAYIPFNSLIPNNNHICDPNNIRNSITQLLNEVNNHKDAHNVSNEVISSWKNIEDDPLYSRITNTNYRKALKSLFAKTNKFPSELSEHDIRNYMDVDELSGFNMFNRQFSSVFKHYHLKVSDNNLVKIDISDGVDTPFTYLEKDEFIEKYGIPPWDFLNEILERLGFPYRANDPNGMMRDSIFEFKLIDEETKLEIKTQDLSTGEQTLISLAFAIYISLDSGEVPELLILDEPDAPLHPTMSKLMLEIIEKDIVEKAGIPVVISSHSPTTIACAPQNCIHKISRKNKIPQLCSFEDVMQVLSNGIPNLSVSTEDRRQVFVEFDYDVEFCERLHQILSRKVRFLTRPYFLPPHQHNGSNSSDVKKITKTLSDMGNDKIYGIIDWDLVNKPSKQLLILGGEKRYSIENYVFEPHIIGLYLVYKGFSSPSELGFDDCQSYRELTSLISKDFSAVQALTESIQSMILPEDYSGKVEITKLVSGNELSLSSFFCVTQGHSLEDLYKEKWPKLNSVRSNNKGDSALKLDVINTVIKDFPELLSQDLVNTFNAIV